MFIFQAFPAQLDEEAIDEEDLMCDSTRYTFKAPLLEQMDESIKQERVSRFFSVGRKGKE